MVNRAASRWSWPLIVVFALGKAGIIAIALTAIAAFVLGLDAQRRDHALSAPVVAVAAAIGELIVLRGIDDLAGRPKLDERRAPAPLRSSAS